ncbi:lipopolysaccharide biosynthesis protein [Mesorhizobium sp. M00.F.Ca.ET.216.01.1.1]|nr:lipopolysaccharide biosynthesis protein [Mesorhizobium sp. M00.F.Ca.ET.216.01.1.1]TJW14849.1 MAG: lipopolysaccharide biosynthesis protein [Mesorhizobium sp.]
MFLGASVQTLGRRARRFWRDEASLRTRLVNISHLLTGNLVGSVVGMLGFLVTARALGATDYGVLALTYSYTRAVGLIVGFQSWQPLIKYGAELSGEEHLDDYRSLLKFGLVVDISAALLSYLVAIGFALLFGPLVGIGGNTIEQVIIYSTVLLFQINGLPTAVFRLAGRFRLLAYGSVVGGIARLVLCAAGLLAGMGLLYFVIVWTLTQVLGSVVVLGMALVEIRRQGMRRFISAPLKGVTERFKGLLSFTIGSNVELTVRSSASEFDTLLVGAFTDPAGAGLYHIAKRLGRLVVQIGVQVQAVLYPDVARLWAQGDLAMFRRTVLQTEIMLAVFGLAMVVGTVLGIQPVLDWTVGKAFAGAGPLAMVQMMAVAIIMSGSALRTALFAMGRQLAVLKVVLVSTLMFHATALTMIPLIGAMGANIANVVMGIVGLIGLLRVYHSAFSAES